MKKIIKQTRIYNPFLKEQLSSSGEIAEERKAQEAVTKFVTDSKGAVYALTPLVPELFAALLKARYSRTELSAKQLLWREFMANKDNINWQDIDKGLKSLNEIFNYQKAEGMAERILLQYGDDSVFELGGAHLFFNQISQLATKFIEDIRIGLSPLEKSTRYVVFDQKNNEGDYSFFKDPKIMQSSYKNIYLKTTRECFDFYAKSVKILQNYFKKQIPLENQEFPDLTKKGAKVPFDKLNDEKSIKAAKIAYEQSIRSKACDITRVILPASTLTNVGEFGNARAYGYLFTKMLSSDLTEIQMLAYEGIRELKKLLPKFFDGINGEFGLMHQEYLKKTDLVLKKKTAQILKNIKPRNVDRVELIKMPEDPEISVVAALLYPYSTLSLSQLLEISQKLGSIKRGNLLHDSLKYRKNRRHKPVRAFEIAGYELVFDILGNFGIYRDLHRQRMLSQVRQPFTTDHGFDMPLEFEEIGLDKKFKEIMAKMKKTHDKVIKVFPAESQYLTNLAHYTRWYMGMNLREAFWLTELRTIPQGHFSYRTIAQDMFLKAQEVYPFLKNLKNKVEQYVDMTDRSKNLERMEAMQQIQIGIAKIEEKYS